MSKQITYSEYALKNYTVSSLSILLGVIAMQGYEKIGGVPSTIVGLPLFIGGWIGIALSLISKEDNKSVNLLGPLGAMMALVGAMTFGAMKKKGTENSTGGMIATGVFVFGWMLVATGATHADMSIVNGGPRLFGAALIMFGVVGSMKFRLPAAEKVGRVRGEGMVMFTLAWMVLVFLGATRPDMIN